MPVVAMKVTEKSAHERTDQLFIYTFDSPANGPRTIVANLTNVYDVGDVAAVCNYRFAHGRPSIHLREGEERELGVLLGEQFKRVETVPGKW